MFKRLQVENFRNLQPFNLDLHPKTNLILGDNGAGKSSFLEALYGLVLGKSFRSREFSKMIMHQQDDCLLVAEYQSAVSLHLVGLKRSRGGRFILKLDGQRVYKQSEIAGLIPIMLVDPMTFQLLDGGPVERRQFIDWGVFHVEHQYPRLLAEYNQALKQRNTLLRTGLAASDRQYDVWEQNITSLGLEINVLREGYLLKFNTLLDALMVDIPQELQGLSLRFSRGWAKDADLKELLSSNRERDLRLGYTREGPHRADWLIKNELGLAKDTYSRGQKKYLTTMLKVAQVLLLKQLTNKVSVVMLDDIGAELGLGYQASLIAMLEGVDTQLFVTALSQDSVVSEFLKEDHKVFHVEHGCIKGSSD